MTHRGFNSAAASARAVPQSARRTPQGLPAPAESANNITILDSKVFTAFLCSTQLASPSTVPGMPWYPHEELMVLRNTE